LLAGLPSRDQRVERPARGPARGERFPARRGERSMTPAPQPPDPGRERLPGAAIARQVKAQGITDPRVLDALARLSRARFLPPRERAHAGEDRALPIGLDQTISQPLMVAVMTVELALTGRERVLEIGTGSGYQTAVLGALAAEV